MKRFVRNAAIFSSLFAVAFGGAFISQYKKPVERNNNSIKPISGTTFKNNGITIGEKRAKNRKLS